MGLSGWDGQLVTFGLGLLFTALAASYVTRLAKVTTLHTKHYNYLSFDNLKQDFLGMCMTCS